MGQKSERIGRNILIKDIQTPYMSSEFFWLTKFGSTNSFLLRNWHVQERGNGCLFIHIVRKKNYLAKAGTVLKSTGLLSLTIKMAHW
jgi:hypothetical protein